MIDDSTIQSCIDGIIMTGSKILKRLSYCCHYLAWDRQEQSKVLLFRCHRDWQHHKTLGFVTETTAYAEICTVELPQKSPVNNSHLPITVSFQYLQNAFYCTCVFDFSIAITSLCRVAESVACLTQELEVPGSIPSLATYCCFSFH